MIASVHSPIESTPEPDRSHPMTPKKFFEMMLRGRELVASFLFDPGFCSFDAQRLIRGIGSFKDKATEQQYFRFVRLNLVVLYQRLTNQRQLKIAEYIYKEFLPAPDQTNLPMMESLFRARKEAKEKVGADGNTHRNPDNPLVA